jgi:hypothetical protein
MSFSDKEKVKNPAKAFFEFKSKKKAFVAYHKETEKEIALPLPARFVVLDELHCFTGYAKKYRSGGYSNEIHNIETEELTVKTFPPKGDPNATTFSKTGLYKDIEVECKGLGLKYTKSLYILYNVPNKGYALYNLKLHGSALGKWFDANINTKKNVVVIKDEFPQETNGDNVYNVPVFESVEMGEDFREEAMKADKEILKPYFNDQKPVDARVED